MKNWTLKAMLAGVIVLTPFGGSPSMAVADDHESNIVHIKAQGADTAVLALDAGTCDPQTILPMPGDSACIGTEKVSGAYSGDLEGTDLFETVFVDFPNLSTNYVLYDTFKGAVAGHGSGSFTIFEHDGLITPDGTETDQWRVVEGSGTGQLTGVTGHGEFVGMLNFNTGLGAGTLEGELEFPGRHQQ